MWYIVRIIELVLKRQLQKLCKKKKKMLLYCHPKSMTQFYVVINVF